ncbi:MAG: PD-(D/E)XK nuclease family protein, partial [Nanoarchaeota archaeon]|nr:PD-(D/E)XK nuclease family protein [Nanoarchaeota archaeon]
MIFSHSRLSCFEQCPQKFKYKYIDKIETEIQESIEAFLGKRVHEALEKLYHDMRLERLRSLEEISEFFNSGWEKNWSGKILMVRSNNPETQKNMGIKFLADYYSKHNPFNHSRTIGLEMPVEFDLDGDGKFKIKGFIDRLSLAGNILEIHDYKTGGRMPAQEHLERDRQLHLYAMAAKKMFPFAEQTNLVWHFLAFDKTIEIKADEKRLELLKNDTIKLIEKINSEKRFLPRESGLCAWCEYQKVCGKC